MSAATSGAGAEFVPQGFADRFFAKLKYYGGVRQAGATVFPTASGNPFPVPLLDDVSHTGELIAENTGVCDDADNDPDTSNVMLGAYIFSSKVVRVPITLAQDSAFPIDTWLADALAERIGAQPEQLLQNRFRHEPTQGLRHRFDLGQDVCGHERCHLRRTARLLAQPRYRLSWVTPN